MKRELHAGDMFTQSNDLVEAFYDSDLSATEHKILRYAASKIKRNPDNFPRVSFSVTEFMDAAGLKGNNYHAQIIKISDELSRKRIKIKSNEKMGWFPWLSGLVYDQGVVHMSFNELIKEYLLELDGQYTRYSYKYIGDMRSSYSIRLFELLKQYAPIGRRRIDLEVLKKMLGISDKYKQYGPFKNRVLNQAKKELDRKNELTFEFEEIKQGRKITEIVFFIKINNRKIIEEKKDHSDLEVETFVKEASLLLERYRFSIDEVVLKNWSKYGINMLNEVLDEISGREIHSPPSYISVILESRQKEKSLISKHIKSEDDKVKETITSFIIKSKTDEITPDWFLKNQFDKFVSSIYSNRERDEMWEANKELIMKEIKIK